MPVTEGTNPIRPNKKDKTPPKPPKAKAQSFRPGVVTPALSQPPAKEPAPVRVQTENPGRIRILQRPEETYYPELSNRATQIDPGFMRARPDIAGDLLLSGVPTRKLGAVSAAAMEGYVRLRGQYGQHLVPIVEVIAIDKRLNRDEITRTNVLTYLRSVHTLLPGEEAEALAAIVTNPELTPQERENAVREWHVRNRNALLPMDPTGGKSADFLALFSNPDQATGEAADAKLTEELAQEVDRQSLDPLGAYSHVTSRTGHVTRIGKGMYYLNPLVPIGAVGGPTFRALGFGEAAATIGGYMQGAEQSFGRLVRGTEATALAIPSTVAAGLDEEAGVAENLAELYNSAWDLETEHGPTATFAIQAGVPEDSDILPVIDFIGDNSVALVIGESFAQYKIARATPEDAYALGPIMRHAQRTADDWSHTITGRRKLKDMVETNLANPDAAAGALLRRYPNIGTRLAFLMSSAKSIPEARRIIVGYMRDPDIPHNVNKVRRALRDIDEKLADPTQDTNALLARKANLEAKMEHYNNYQLVDAFPQRRTLGRTMDLIPGNKYIRTAAAALFQRSGITPDDLANNLPTRPRVGTTRATPTEVFEFTRTITEYLKLARTPEELIVKILDDYIKNANSRGGLYKWYDEKFIPAVEHGLRHGGTRELTPDVLEKLHTALRRDELDAMQSPMTIETADARGNPYSVLINAAEDPVTKRPLPSQWNESLAEIRLPDVNFVRQAAHTIRVADSLPPSVRPKYEAATWMGSLPFRVSTKIGKPLVLIGVPRLVLRATIIEQSLRNIFYGFTPFATVRRFVKKADLLAGGTPVAKGGWLRRRFGTRDLMKGEDPAEVGTLLSEEMADIRSVSVPFNTRNLGPDGIATAAERTSAARAVADQLQHLASAEMNRRLVTSGPEATLKWLLEDQGPDGVWFREEFIPESLPRLYPGRSALPVERVKGSRAKPARDLTFEEWKESLGSAGSRKPVMVSMEWLRERTTNNTPRTVEDLLGRDYEQIAAQMDADGWNPQEPLAVVYDYKENTFAIYDGTHRLNIAEGLGMKEIPVEFMGNADMQNTFKMLQREFPDQMKTARVPEKKAIQGDEGAAITWLKQKLEGIEQYTGGDATLLDMIGTGRLVGGTAPRRPIAGDLAEIKAAIREAKKTGQDPMKISELRAEKRRLIDEERHKVTYDRAPSDAPDTLGWSRRQLQQNSTGVADRAPIVNRILENPDYVWPDQILIKKRASTKDDMAPGGRAAVDATLDRISETLYKPLRFWGKADVMLTRGSMFFQEMLRMQTRLERRGYSKSQASKIAQARAGFITRERMYDLSARSSFDRATKHLFWFAPAAREIATTWFVTLPNRRYWPVGMSQLMFHYNSSIDMLKEAGVLKTREYEGETQTYITFPSPFNDDTIEMSLDSLMSLFPMRGNIPTTLSPAAQKTGELLGEHVPALKKLTALLSFSDDITLFPGWFKKSWELMTSEPFPLEFLSQEAEDRAVTMARDRAYQLAASNLIKDGDLMPRREQFDSDEAYEDARAAWLTRLDSEADSMHTALTATQLFGMLVGPATMKMTTPAREAYEKWRKEVNITWPYSDKEYDLIDEYVEAHPEAAPFTISYWEHGANDPDVPEDAEFWDKVRSGELFAADPEAYKLELQARLSMSYEYELLARDFRKAGFGKHVGTAETLRRAGEYDKVMDKHSRRLERYFSLNREVEDWWLDNQEKMAELYGEPVMTSDQQAFYELNQLLDANSHYFLGAGGQAAEGWGELQAKIRKRMGEFPEPSTRFGKERAWWFDNVLSPYMEAIGPLYDRAERLTEAGLDAGHIYDKIRQLSNDYGEVNKFGQNLPGAEEYLFGLKTDRARESTVAGWATRPPTWLTQFQLGRAYGNVIGDVDQAKEVMYFLRRIDTGYRAAYGNASTDAEKASLNRQRAAMYEEVRRYYPGAQQLIKLVDATPVVRLVTSGFGKGNDDFKWAMTEATRIAQRIEAEGYNPAYDSEFALKQKVPFLQELERRREAHEAFDELWDTLSFAVPEKGYDQRRDVPLYVAILFGQFGGTYYSPEALIALVERG